MFDNLYQYEAKIMFKILPKQRFQICPVIQLFGRLSSTQPKKLHDLTFSFSKDVTIARATFSNKKVDQIESILFGFEFDETVHMIYVSAVNVKFEKKWNSFKFERWLGEKSEDGLCFVRVAPDELPGYLHSSLKPSCSPFEKNEYILPGRQRYVLKIEEMNNSPLTLPIIVRFQCNQDRTRWLHQVRSTFESNEPGKRTVHLFDMEAKRLSRLTSVVLKFETSLSKCIFSLVIHVPLILPNTYKGLLKIGENKENRSTFQVGLTETKFEPEDFELKKVKKFETLASDLIDFPSLSQEDLTVYRLTSDIKWLLPKIPDEGPNVKIKIIGTNGSSPMIWLCNSKWNSTPFDTSGVDEFEFEIPSLGKVEKLVVFCNAPVTWLYVFQVFLLTEYPDGADFIFPCRIPAKRKTQGSLIILECKRGAILTCSLDDTFRKLVDGECVRATDPQLVLRIQMEEMMRAVEKAKIQDAAFTHYDCHIITGEEESSIHQFSSTRVYIKLIGTGGSTDKIYFDQCIRLTKDKFTPGSITSYIIVHALNVAKIESVEVGYESYNDDNVNITQISLNIVAVIIRKQYSREEFAFAFPESYTVPDMMHKLNPRLFHMGKLTEPSGIIRTGYKIYVHSILDDGEDIDLQDDIHYQLVLVSNKDKMFIDLKRRDEVNTLLGTGVTFFNIEDKRHFKKMITSVIIMHDGRYESPWMCKSIDIIDEDLEMCYKFYEHYGVVSDFGNGKFGFQLEPSIEWIKAVNRIDEPDKINFEHKYEKKFGISKIHSPEKQSFGVKIKRAFEKVFSSDTATSDEEKVLSDKYKEKELSKSQIISSERSLSEIEKISALKKKEQSRVTNIFQRSKESKKKHGVKTGLPNSLFIAHANLHIDDINEYKRNIIENIRVAGAADVVLPLKKEEKDIDLQQMKDTEKSYDLTQDADIDVASEAENKDNEDGGGLIDANNIGDVENVADDVNVDENTENLQENDSVEAVTAENSKYETGYEQNIKTNTSNEDLIQNQEIETAYPSAEKSDSETALKPKVDDKLAEVQKELNKHGEN